MTDLVLSIFPGIDLLGRGFEAEGFCVVRGPDKIFGGDIRDFHPPPNVFRGVIGGPPCQDFSSLRRDAAGGNGIAMLAQFVRVVRAAQPQWWLLENVARVPDVVIDGYFCQRLDVDLKWFAASARRLRHVQFGSRDGRQIHIDRRRDGTCDPPSRHGAALANDDRPFRELCRLQGLPDDFDLPGFTVAGKKAAVGNGVPFPMAAALAAAVRAAYERDSPDLQLRLDGPPEQVGCCPCGCRRRLPAGRSYYDDSCRKRAQRRRDRSIGKQRVHQ